MCCFGVALLSLDWAVSLFLANCVSFFLRAVFSWLTLEVVGVPWHSFFFARSQTLGVLGSSSEFLLTRGDVVASSAAACLVPGRLVDAPFGRLAFVPDGCWLLRMRFG